MYLVSFWDLPSVSSCDLYLFLVRYLRDIYPLALKWGLSTLLIGCFELPWWAFVWEDSKDTAGGIWYGIILKWSGRRCQHTVCRVCLCVRGDFLVVFWDLVVLSTILLMVPVSLATLSFSFIGLIIFLYHMILYSRRHITSWWRLKRCGLGRVRRVPVWMPQGDMKDLSVVWL